MTRSKTLKRLKSSKTLKPSFKITNNSPKLSLQLLRKIPKNLPNCSRLLQTSIILSKTFPNCSKISKNLPN